jgi:hypothetical protein
MKAPILALVAAGSLGCATMEPSQVTLEGAPVQVAALAGKWAGEYSSPVTGRTGSILFTLVAGDDHAHGDVVMMPHGDTRAYRPVEPTAPRRQPPQVLTIRFVRAAEGSVSGVLDPYWDPDCGCEARTTFSGRLTGDAIEGTFTTQTSEAAGPSYGRWKADRRR